MIPTLTKGPASRLLCQFQDLILELTVCCLSRERSDALAPHRYSQGRIKRKLIACMPISQIRAHFLCNNFSSDALSAYRFFSRVESTVNPEKRESLIPFELGHRKISSPVIVTMTVIATLSDPFSVTIHVGITSKRLGKDK